MDRDQIVDRLLHDAEHAESGRQFAARIGHVEPAKDLTEKRDRLLAKAQELDPAHEAPAWKEHAEWLKR